MQDEGVEAAEETGAGGGRAEDGCAAAVPRVPGCGEVAERGVGIDQRVRDYRRLVTGKGRGGGGVEGGQRAQVGVAAVGFRLESAGEGS